MKSVAIIFLALIAMSFAQVNVADNNPYNNADGAFGRPSADPASNIHPNFDGAFGRPSAGPASNIRPDSDSFYSQPSGGRPVTKPHYGPTYVNNGDIYPRPYDNPFARGGK